MPLLKGKGPVWPGMDGSGAPSSNPVRRRDKVMAACTGATITSLTMTPFDVVKTRLQTQPNPPPLFLPSPGPSSSSATCCQRTYFSANADSLLCRFDPRSPSQSPSTSTLTRFHPPQLSTAARFLHPSSSAFAALASPSIALSTPSANCEYPDAPSASRALPRSHPTTLVGSFAAIARNEGVSALWRGVAPALAMSVPAQAVYMVGYDALRASFFLHAPRVFWSDSGARPGPHGEGLAPAYRSGAAPLAAGCLSRTAVATLVSPLELLRTRLQSLPHPSSADARVPSLILRSTLSTVRSQGLRSLWRGLGATLWRDVPFSGVYWSSYEVLRRMLSGGKGLGQASEGEGAKWRTAGVSFVSGAASGCLAAIATNPFDVVKTRRQAELHRGRSERLGEGTWAVLRRVWRDEGKAGMMKGLTPRLAKIVPACGIMIACYEGLAQVLADL